MRFFLGFIFILLAALALLATYSSSSYYRAVLAEDTTVVIPPGTGAQQTLEILHAEGATPEPWKIAMPVLMRGQYRSFKAGEYALAAGMTPEQVLNRIARGDVVVHRVTIPEGYTSAQVVLALMGEPLLTGGFPLSMLEGHVFPNTYHFERNEKREALIARMTQAMDVKLAELWNTRAPDLPLATPEQALTLASIVEKETSVAAERSMVAGVYINRLRKGMKLQADPTVAYGIDPEGDSKHVLTLADLNRDTPYNTYMRGGLPPGPICNPGAASIEAVLHPAQTEALYFVADGKGGHNFAVTEKEHERNVIAYRRLTRAPAPPTPAPAAPPAPKKRALHK